MSGEVDIDSPMMRRRRLIEICRSGRPFLQRSGPPPPASPASRPAKQIANKPGDQPCDQALNDPPQEVAPSAPDPLVFRTGTVGSIHPSFLLPFFVVSGGCRPACAAIMCTRSGWSKSVPPARSAALRFPAEPQFASSNRCSISPLDFRGLINLSDPNPRHSRWSGMTFGRTSPS